MAAAARKIELEPQMNERTVLEEKVDHIQKDVTDLKTDVRALTTGLAEHRLGTEKSFGKLREEMKDSLARLRTSQSAQIAWMVGTVIAAIGAGCAAAKLLAAQ